MDRQLETVLERAAKSPFYRERLKRISQWREAPFTTKADLRAAYPFGLLAVDRKALASYHESSGTEGEPIASFFTQSDWCDIGSRFLRSGVDLISNDLLFIKTPYSMVTTAHQAHRAAEIAGATIVPGDNRSTNMPYSRVVRLLSKLECTVTWSLPTEVMLWAIAARENGLDPATDFPALRAFWVAGEPLSPSKRETLRRLWAGKAIWEDYGSTETGTLGGELACGKMHLWSDRIHFEVLKEDGSVGTAGRGELVVTPLHREAMPLVRYRTGDEVVIESGPCACESHLPRIQVLGRLGQRLTIADRSLYPIEIEEAVYREGASFNLLLFRAVHESTGLKIEFFGEGRADANFAMALSERLKVPVVAEHISRDSFIHRSRLVEPLSFSKPKFIFSREENPSRQLHSL